MRNNFFRPQRVSAFRILAVATWDAPADPTVYGLADIDCHKLGPWLEEKRRTTGQRLTYTHAVARAIAIVLAEHPELNCLIRRGRIWQRRDVDVFLQVAVPNEEGRNLQGADLSGALIRQADTKSIGAIAEELQAKSALIRARKDPELARIKSNLAWMPAFLARPLMRVLSWLNHDLGLDLRWLGVPDDPFGSFMITSLGMHGIRYGFAPLFTNARAMGIIMVGSVVDDAVVRDGQVVVRPVLPMTLSADHRIIDGLQASVLSREIIDLLENPEGLDREVRRPPSGT